MQQQYPGESPPASGFDNGLAHRIEAGADIFDAQPLRTPG
jgi:hypothetical protein